MGRDDVASGAAQEHVAGFGLEDEGGNDAGIGAGDEEDIGLLHVGQKVELVLHAGEHFAAEAGVAVEETLHYRLQVTGLRVEGATVRLVGTRPERTPKDFPIVKSRIRFLTG